MTQNTEIKDNFRQQLRDLVSRARREGNRVSSQQVEDALSTEGLTKDKLKMVYAYLEQTGIEIYDGGENDASDASQHRPSLEIYLEELEKLAQLPEDTERRMFELAAGGDPEAKRVLIERYLPAVCDLAGEFEGREKGIDPEDLVQEANIGLVLAMEELQMEESLAAWRVKLLNSVTAYLENSVRSMSDAARSDQKIADRMNRLADTVHDLEDQLEHKPSLEEVSAWLDVPAEEIKNLLRMGGEKLTIEDI